MAFYRRRAGRLFPALGLLVLRCSATSGAIYVALYGANVGRINGALRGGPLEHTWSLAIEEQFYLVWPAVLIVLLRARRPALFVGLAVAVVALHRVGLEADAMRVANGPDTRADVLLLGALAALTVERLATVRWAALAAVAAVPLAWATFAGPALQGSATPWWRACGRWCCCGR